MGDSESGQSAAPSGVVQALDHLYLETRSFDAAAAFWQALGFTFAERWGDEQHRAGRLVSGSASVVLAEGRAGAEVVHFKVPKGALDGLAAALEDSPHVKIVTPLEKTHWGTRWLRVQDSDRRIFALEEPA
ncbi:MAG TPA: hypothetical protein VFX49_13845 [Chloroflexota bacterium]|nr:hypothetical protein [Chloroflexota bacterium]